MSTINRSEFYFKNFNITDKSPPLTSYSLPDITESAICPPSLFANNSNMGESTGISVSWGHSRLLSTISTNTIHNFIYTLGKD